MYLHFVDEEMKAQRSQLTCLRFQSWKAAEVGLESKLGNIKPGATKDTSTNGHVQGFT